MGIFGTKQKKPLEELSIEECFKEGSRAYDKMDYARALPYLLRVAEEDKSNAYAVYYCGNIYSNEREKELYDIERAKEFYTRAKELGSTNAERKLRYIQRNEWKNDGWDALQRGENEKGFNLLMQAAEADDLTVFELVASLYEKGCGTRADEEKALFWYKEAAKHNFPKSQYICALRDTENADYWYAMLKKNRSSSAKDYLIKLEQERASSQPEPTSKPRSEAPQPRTSPAQQEAEELYQQALAAVNNRPQNWETACRCCLKAVSLGHKEAAKLSQTLTKAEQMWKKGADAFQNKRYSSAVKPLAFAAKYGHPTAQLYCGTLYLNGKGCKEDPKKALEYFKQAAEAGIADAAYSCGMLYRLGQGVERNPILAFRWFEQAAQNGNADAQCMCGTAYIYGDGVKQDMQQAAYWLEKAAAQGNKSAQDKLVLAVDTYAMAQAGGAYIQKKDYAHALPLIRYSAQNDIPAAQFLYGMMYQLGMGVAENEKEARFWLEKAAKNGDLDAQLQCAGLCEAKGNHKTELYWLEQAAERGNLSAMFNCGIMYRDGEGCTADKAKALYWFERAAMGGDAGAACSCGIMYCEGNGVPADQQKGRRYLQQAVDSGDKEAAQRAQSFLKNNG